MSGLHEARDRMRQSGFTLIEMLIALAVTLLIGGAIAGAVPPARAAFDRVPVELEMQQRGRTAIALLGEALRSADRIEFASANEAGTYAQLTVIIPAVTRSQGVLEVDQGAAAAAMTLAPTPCPNAPDLCGFVAGATVVATDAAGGYDVFIVSSIDAAARQLMPNRALSRAYAAGASIVEAEAYTYVLGAQPDGSCSLIRVTAAGAVQPVVDFVSRAAFWRDGPRASVEVTLQAPTEALRRVIPDRTFTTSVAVRNAS
jgi:prepilin-type N-terminal cleavage/methylation domain-containing protein